MRCVREKWPWVAFAELRRTSRAKHFFLAELKPHQGCHMIVPPMPLFDAFLQPLKLIDDSSKELRVKRLIALEQGVSHKDFT